MLPETEADWTVHSLNIHGLFLERWCANVFRRQKNWSILGCEYPVKFPPESHVDGRETAIDVLAQTSDGELLFTFIIECKKHNPELVNWIMFKARKRSQHGWVPVLRRLSSHRDKQWQVVRHRTMFGTSFVDSAREARSSYRTYKDGSSKTKTSNSSISDAAYQVALGTQGLIAEELKRANHIGRSNLGRRKGSATRREVFIPLIVTTAVLKTAEFDPAAIDPASGEIAYDQVKFRDVDSVIFDYRLPRHLQDARVEQMRSRRGVAIWSSLPIIVASAQKLPELLASGKLLQVVNTTAA